MSQKAVTHLTFRILLFLWLIVYLFCSFWLSQGYMWALLWGYGPPPESISDRWLSIFNGMYTVHRWGFFVYALALIPGMSGLFMRSTGLMSLCVIGTSLIFWSSLLCSLPSVIATVLQGPAYTVMILLWIGWMAASFFTWRAVLWFARAEKS